MADIEGHLNNTASLVGGDQIPMWSGVLKMMEYLGYANPRHNKVCAAHDHSFLLKSNEGNPVLQYLRETMARLYRLLLSWFELLRLVCNIGTVS